MSRVNDSITDSMISAIDALLEKVKDDPDDLKLYKKIFKKTVPFHLRSWTTAYLLKQLVEPKSRRKITDGTTLFISVGKNRRVYPRDLIQLFVGTGKINREEIGEIKVLDSYSFLSVKESSAATAIDNLDGINFRGRNLVVNFAKKK
ncbi:MAG: DbpA RNA binding domain-containing protein [Spirochaetaceae bacterium]|jgi:ATP-dependent RNA helicase DeaD|nr:DbpA RNA binding domain-containing protein [Spirochaetaceae bacterium]